MILLRREVGLFPFRPEMDHLMRMGRDIRFFSEWRQDEHGVMITTDSVLPFPEEGVGHGFLKKLGIMSATNVDLHMCKFITSLPVLEKAMKVSLEWSSLAISRDEAKILFPNAESIVLHNGGTMTKGYSLP